MRTPVFAGSAVAAVVLGGLLWLVLAHAEWTSSQSSAGLVNAWSQTGDMDGDGLPDSPDNCPAWPNPDQSLPPWPVPADDPDCDGFTDADETFVGTDPLASCSTTSTANDEHPDAWPPDFNDSQRVDIFDVNILKPAFFSVPPGPPYDARFDLKPDDRIDIFDVNVLKPFFFLTCTP